MTVRFATLCSGIGCAELAAEPLGWEGVFQSEIDPFACSLLQQRFPLTPNLGDMTTLAQRIREGEIDDRLPDVLVAGTPCFPAGTMVATSTGFKPIESVTRGELVLTHEGRFKPVLRTGSKIAATWLLRGQGHPFMETTAEHPFLSMKREARSTRVKGKAIRQTWWSERGWIHASDMSGRHWAFTENWPTLPIPSIDLHGQEKVTVPVDAALLRLAGAYVGDGWVRINERRGTTILGLNSNKLEIIKPYVHDLGLNTTKSSERTTTKLTVHGRALARWLYDNFGSGAKNKCIPIWLLGAPREFREAFLQEYIDTDGSSKNLPSWLVMTATTVSRQLALMLRSLMITLGHACSVQYAQVPPTTIIEERTVNQKPQWQVRPSTSDRSSVSKDGFRWQLVRESKPSGVAKEVFNLEIADDNSYVVDGIVVHNCQAFSIAGLQQSLDDARGNLTLELVRVLEAIDHARERIGIFDCCTLVWENVPGVLSTKDNAFGCFVGALVGAEEPIPAFGKQGRWPRAGLVRGPRRSVAWRILDAQYFGLAQRRRRVFLVAGAGIGFDPAAVLLESDGVRRNSAPSREAREAVAVPLASGVTRGSGYRNDIDMVDNLIAFGGNNQSGAIDVATARSAHGGPHGRLDFETETFLVTGGQVTHALNTANDGKHSSEDGTGRGVPIIAFDALAAGNTGFSISENTAGSLRSSGNQVGHAAVAFQDRFRGDDGRGYDRPPPVTNEIVGALETVKPWNVATAMQVRRLTVTECERLQGLPEVRKSTTIFVCSSDHQLSSAIAEIQNHRSQKYVWNVDYEKSLQFAQSAKHHLNINLQESEWPVVVHVLINLERKVVQIRNLEKSLLFVPGVEELDTHHLAVPLEDFVHLLAHMPVYPVQEIHSGKVESLQNTQRSLGQLTGNVYVPLYGYETKGYVSDAINPISELKKCIKFITSEAMPNSPNYEHALKTWCCCVMDVINSFIPDTTQNMNSYIVKIESIGSYTDVIYRKKQAADGPRYRAIGNGMAVPVVSWILERLDRHMKGRL